MAKSAKNIKKERNIVKIMRIPNISPDIVPVVVVRLRKWINLFFRLFRALLLRHDYQTGQSHLTKRETR